MKTKRNIANNITVYCLTALFALGMTKVIEKDIKGLKDVNRLGYEMMSAHIVNHVMQDGETYSTLRRKYFPIGKDEHIQMKELNKGFPGSDEIYANNMYRRSITLINGHSSYSLWEPKTGDTIKIPIRE